MPFSYVVIQFNVKHLDKIYDLIVRLFNIIVHYMKKMALRALWLRFTVNLLIYRPFAIVLLNIMATAVVVIMVLVTVIVWYSK